MCDNITVPILHIAISILQTIAFQTIPNFLFHNNLCSNTLHLMTFDLVDTYRVKGRPSIGDSNVDEKIYYYIDLTCFKGTPHFTALIRKV